MRVVSREWLTGSPMRLYGASHEISPAWEQFRLYRADHWCAAVNRHQAWRLFRLYGIFPAADTLRPCNPVRVYVPIQPSSVCL